jgi:hypothetical protein
MGAKDIWADMPQRMTDWYDAMREDTPDHDPLD